MLAETWIKQIIETLNVLKCFEDKKVSFTTFMFEGKVGHWWEVTERVLGNRNNESITWEMF